MNLKFLISPFTNVINKLILSFLLRFKLKHLDRILKFKVQNSVFLKINNKIFHINIEDINYLYFEVRQLKSEIINHYYFKKINLNHPFKEHFYNYLLNQARYFDRKASLIKYLFELNYPVKEVNSFYISKNDKNIFRIYFS